MRSIETQPFFEVKSAARTGLFARCLLVRASSVRVRGRVSCASRAHYTYTYTARRCDATKMPAVGTRRWRDPTSCPRPDEESPRIPARSETNLKAARAVSTVALCVLLPLSLLAAYFATRTLARVPLSFGRCPLEQLFERPRSRLRAHLFSFPASSARALALSLLLSVGHKVSSLVATRD